MMLLSRAVALLLAQLRKPYVWGANGPDKFDCSGLAFWWFNQTGNKRTDTTAQGFYNRTVATTGTPRLGDLVFLYSGGRITHMGIMLNATTVIEARGRAYGVVQTALSDFKSRSGYLYRGIRRDPLFTLEPDATVPNASYEFNVGFGAQQNKRFGGLPSDSPARVTMLRKLLYIGLVGLTETDPLMLRTILKSYPHHRELHLSTNTTTLLYDTRRWTPRDTREVLHGDDYHGALCVPVVPVGVVLPVEGFDVIVNHTRPKAVASKDDKIDDVLRALSLRRTWPSIIMGDFAMNADKLMEMRSMRRLSEDVDTYDPEGDTRIDAIYGSKHFKVVKTQTRNPERIADHLWQFNKLTVGA